MVQVGVPRAALATLVAAAVVVVSGCTSTSDATSSSAALPSAASSSAALPSAASGSGPAASSAVPSSVVPSSTAVSSTSVSPSTVASTPVSGSGPAVTARSSGSSTPAPSSRTSSPPATSGGSTSSPALTTTGSSYGSTSRATTTTSVPLAATTPVPPPTSGNIDQTVPAGTVTTKPSVAISATAAFSSEVTVEVARIRKLNLQAEGPGEISGPGLEITVRIANGTAKAIDLGNTIVDLTDSEGNPTVPIMSGNVPITGTLAADATASGTYQFKIPANLRNPVTIAVSYTTSAPVIVFSGKVG